jgi:hypothetical protein
MPSSASHWPELGESISFCHSRRTMGLATPSTPCQGRPGSSSRSSCPLIGAMTRCISSVRPRGAAPRSGATAATPRSRGRPCLRHAPLRDVASAHHVAATVLIEIAGFPCFGAADLARLAPRVQPHLADISGIAAVAVVRAVPSRRAATLPVATDRALFSILDELALCLMPCLRIPAVTHSCFPLPDCTLGTYPQSSPVRFAFGKVASSWTQTVLTH